MSSTPASTGYSAEVRLHLVVSNDTLELASIGPEGICLRSAVELPLGPAEVVMHVDDFERRWKVYLPDGIAANSREVRTETRSAASGSPPIP